MLGKLALSLLTTSSLGASLMYLLDPDSGEKHRKGIKRSAMAAYDAARESAQSGWETAKEKSVDLRETLADRLAEASNVVSPAASRAREYALDERYVEEPSLTPGQSMAALALARRSRELHGEARDAYARARDMYYDALIDLELARARYRKEQPKVVARPKAKVKIKGKDAGPDYLTISLVAAGCCALGAATMFIFDPVAGRRRRAVVRDKTTSAVRRTSKAAARRVSRASKYVSDHGQGAMAQAKSAFRSEDVTDEKVVARVRSEMGRVISNPSAVEVTADCGQVTLKGVVAPTEFDALLKCVYATPGVREVVNRLETAAMH